MLRQELLNQVKQVGLDLKAKAEPSYWPHEQRVRAKEYQKFLQACRQLWADINTGVDVSKAFQKAFQVINTGVERNALSRILRDYSQSEAN